MRPVFWALMTNDAQPGVKPAWAELPFKDNFRHLEKLVERLRIEEGKEEIRVLRYRADGLPAPDADYNWWDADSIAECLVKFTPAQMKSLRRLCRDFGLTFKNIEQFLRYLYLAKGLSRDEIAESGVPVDGGGAEISGEGKIL